MRADGSCDFYTNFPLSQNKHGRASVDEGNITSLFGCNEVHHLKCDQTDPVCYNISHICVYTIVKHGILVPCQQGEHMQDCTSFECNMMFKCPGYYCVHWQYVCDGKWDCPGGLDETATICSSSHCKNMMRCKRSQICLHLGLVCDGKKQCPLGDDEMFCGLHNIQCPDVCQCLTYSLVCTAVFQWQCTQDTLPFRIITVTYSSIIITEALASLLHHPVVVVLSNDQLGAVCGILKNAHLCSHLDVGFNNIAKVDAYCFPLPTQILTLKLNNNKIKHVPPTFIC